MKYGKALISGGGSTTRIPVVELAIFAPDASKSQGMEDPSVNATVRPLSIVKRLKEGVIERPGVLPRCEVTYVGKDDQLCARNDGGKIVCVGTSNEFLAIALDDGNLRYFD
jgi:hypothetical protein